MILMKTKRVVSGKDAIPDWHSVLNLLDVVADYFVLDVVEHADTQENPKKKKI